MDKWATLKDIVKENEVKMKGLELKELTKGKKSGKKLDTYNGAYQAFSTVSKIMAEIEDAE